MSDIELIMTDEFVEFSEKIKQILTVKKEKQASFRKIYDAFMAEIKTLDEQAAVAKKEYDAWALSRTKGVEMKCGQADTPSEKKKA